MRLVADANVLLSAVIGGRARLVLQCDQVADVFTAEATLAEVEEYAPILAKKRGLPEDLLLLAVAALPVSVIPREEYARNVSEAKRRIGQRDPDDVDILALALHLRIPLWTNDRDFEQARVESYATEQLLRKLGL